MGTHGSDYSERQNVQTSTTSETSELGRVDVEIQGKTLSIRSDRDAEVVQELADYIDETLGDLREAAPGAPSDKLLMMASLTVAEELFEARSEIDRLRGEIEDRVADMRQLIEQLDD